jgi:hypothetical protein
MERRDAHGVETIAPPQEVKWASSKACRAKNLQASAMGPKPPSDRGSGNSIRARHFAPGIRAVGRGKLAGSPSCLDRNVTPTATSALLASAQGNVFDVGEVPIRSALGASRLGSEVRRGTGSRRSAGSSLLDLRLEPTAVSALAASSLQSALGAVRRDSDSGRGVVRSDSSGTLHPR